MGPLGKAEVDKKAHQSELHTAFSQETEQCSTHSHDLKCIKHQFSTITSNVFLSLLTHYLVLSQKDSRVTHSGTEVAKKCFHHLWFHTIQACLSTTHGAFDHG